MVRLREGYDLELNELMERWQKRFHSVTTLTQSSLLKKPLSEYISIAAGLTSKAIEAIDS
jgi:hypothetical protein